MTALYLVVPLALAVSGLFLLAFVWSVRHGQLDDLKTPAHRILEEDTESRAAKEPTSGPTDSD